MFLLFIKLNYCTWVFSCKVNSRLCLKGFIFVFINNSHTELEFRYVHFHFLPVIASIAFNFSSLKLSALLIVFKLWVHFDCGIVFTLALTLNCWQRFFNTLLVNVFYQNLLNGVYYDPRILKLP